MLAVNESKHRKVFRRFHRSQTSRRHPLFLVSLLTFSHQSLPLFPHGFAGYLTNPITKFIKIWKIKTSLITRLFSTYLGVAQTSKKALIFRGGISDRRWVQVGRCFKVRLWHQATCVLVHRHCELDIMDKWKTPRILQNLCCLVKIIVKKYSLCQVLWLWQMGLWDLMEFSHHMEIPGASVPWGPENALQRLFFSPLNSPAVISGAEETILIWALRLNLSSCPATVHLWSALFTGVISSFLKWWCGIGYEWDKALSLEKSP